MKITNPVCTIISVVEDGGQRNQTKPITKTASGFSVVTRWRTYLWHGAHFVHLADELAVGLIEQEQLEVQLVQPLAELQLLEREDAWERTAVRARSVKLARSDTHTLVLL